MPDASESSIHSTLTEGRNCWRVRRTPRAALLVDAAAHFSAVVAAVRKARRSILIAGWDVDSRVELIRATEDDPASALTLGDFLNATAEATPGLHVHILCWDFPVLYALERQPLPLFNLGWKTHRRVHFLLDSEHPLGGSHHQKLVVVDDRVAFCGGIDLTQRRWDTPDHHATQPKRKDPSGASYGPFHDMSMIVDGDVAADLGELLRERWRRVTSQRIPAPDVDPGADPWPVEVSPTLADASVGIARTDPAYRGRREIREVERLYIDSIRGAQRSIYVENQFLTSQAIAGALANRLEDADAPEVVLVINLIGSGWLEESTMDAMRGRVIERLQQADKHRRLRVYCPVVPSSGNGEDEPEGEVDVKVHAKLMIVDDRLLRVGSSNLNNRSMGLDSECDLALEAATDEQRRAIRTCRDTLLAEHLGSTPEEVAAAIDDAGGLIAGIEKLNGNARGLRSLPDKAGHNNYAIVLDRDLTDPERPVTMDQMIDGMLKDDQAAGTDSGFRWSWLFRGGLVLLIAVVMAAVWRYTPLREAMNQEALIRWSTWVEAGRYTPLYLFAAFIVAGLTRFPVTVLVATTAAVFDLLPSIAYATSGSLAAAMVAFVAGRSMGRNLVRRVGGKRLNRLSRHLARRGLTTVVIVRLLPVAPFTIVNMVAGATRIRARDFALGTVLGMAPGIIGTSVLVNQVKHLVERPSLGNSLMVAVLALGILAGGTWLARRARRSPAFSESSRPPDTDRSAAAESTA